MRTNSRMRGPALGLAALALIITLPERARAQQGGLFPNAPIRRQRVPCDQEDPVYKTYKYKYYGYHPTCWRPFPEGWGCPSPEAPDKKKSFEKQPLVPREGEQPGAMPGPETPEQPETTRPALPAVPRRGVDPFETQPEAGAPGAAPTAPRDRRPPIPPARDPFQLDKPDNPPAAAPNPPRAARTRPGTAPALSNGPELSAPAEERSTSTSTGTRTSQTDENDSADAHEEGGPMLALPNVDLPPVNDSGTFGIEPPPAAGRNVAAAGSTNPSPGSSPPRRSFLSGLFSNLGLNWTRR
jgi:hypothetical protein